MKEKLDELISSLQEELKLLEKRSRYFKCKIKILRKEK